MYGPKEKKGKSVEGGGKKDAWDHALPTSSLNIPSTERSQSVEHSHPDPTNYARHRKHRYRSGKSRGYDTLNRSTSDKWRS